MLHLYKPLGDNDQGIRLEAANSLSEYLLALLGGEHSEKTKSEVDYALRRLTKGLASGRESARPGFAVVLTEFLAQVQSEGNAEKWDLPLDKIISLVETHTHPQGHSTGPEERDCHLGRLFGLKALVQSGVLFTPSAVAEYGRVLSLLFDLSKKKPWLRESCAWTICSSVQAWPDEGRPLAATTTYAALADSGLAKSSEGAALWITLQAYCPNISAPSNIWVKDSPLDMSNLESLARVLKEVDLRDDGSDGSSMQKGSWNPKLHFVWDLVFSAYFGEEDQWLRLRREKGAGMVAWGEFWKIVVDESLFSAASSEERKFWGFMVFNKALARLTSHPDRKQDLGVIFSRNFMRCLVNQLSDPERYLNKAAQKCTRGLLLTSEASPWAVPMIFKQLISGNGTLNFDSLTKTKTLGGIVVLAHKGGLDEIVGEYRRILIDPLGTTEDGKNSGASQEQQVKTVETRRELAANQMLALIRNGKSAKAESWIGSIVSLLARFGHLETPIDETEELGSAVSITSQKMFRSRLFSCLSHLITAKGIGSGDKTWPYRAVQSILKTKVDIKNPPNRLVVELDDAIEGSIKTARQMLGKINKKVYLAHSTIVEWSQLTKARIQRSAATKAQKPKRAGQLESFELLYSLVILQILNGEADSLELIEELEICYNKAIRKRGETKEDFDVSEVLVEILLSFLSKPSALLRKLAHQVFTAFVEGLTEGGLELMTNVLETKENLGGQQELFDRVDGESEGDEGDIGDNEELGSDVEVRDAEGMDIDSSVSIDDGASSTPESETEASKLEAALLEALGPHKATTASDSDSDMDDEAMLALDESLIKVFKQHTTSSTRSKKQDSKAAREAITDFKGRVLDLLDIFAKSPSAPPHARPDLVVLPLLRCIRMTTSKPVADKAMNVIRTYARNPPPTAATTTSDPIQEARLWDLLEAIHQEAALDGGVGRASHKSACSAASLMTLKMLVGKGKDKGGPDAAAVERVVNIYAKTMTRWLTDRRCKVNGGMFTDFVNWANSVSKQARAG